VLHFSTFDLGDSSGLLVSNAAVRCLEGHVFGGLHRHESVPCDVLADELDLGDRLHAQHDRLSVDAHCAFLSRLHVEEFFLAGMEHQLAHVGAERLENALENCALVSCSLPRRPRVLVRLEHEDAALGAHVLQEEERPRRLYVELLVLTILAEVVE